MPNKLKTKAEYCTEVAAMPFKDIQRDQRLLNALSKALKAAKSDEQFLYLNDKKRDATYLYETYVKDINLPKFINISASMIRKCEAVAADPKKLAKALESVTEEALTLFQQNLRPNFMASKSCEAWCDWMNEEVAKEECAKRGAKLSKVLGIDKKLVTEALTQVTIARFNKDEKAVSKAMADIQAEGEKAQAKEIQNLILSELDRAGLI